MTGEDSSYIRPSHIDLSQIEAINQKRTVAFINYWVLHTVSFLNRFSSICEERLRSINTKIRRASDSLALLEDKLSSIPGLEVTTESTELKSQPTEQVKPENVEIPTNQSDQQVTKTENAEPIIEEKEDVVDNITPIKSDPRFATYFKMLAVGVPEPAVKIKMTAAGLDPKLLDNPDAPAPPADENNESSGDESSSSWD